MEVVALKKVCVSTSQRFLEQRISIKFCAKSVNNASNTCAMLSEDYRRETVRKLCVLKAINGSKRVVKTWKVMKEVVIQDVTEQMRMLRKLHNLVHSSRRLISELLIAIVLSESMKLSLTFCAFQAMCCHQFSLNYTNLNM
jgi:hypothetical protein